MKKTFFPLLALMLLVSMEAMPQPPAHSLRVLRSWTHHEAMGDLNKDGIQDLAIIAVPPEQAPSSTPADEEDSDYREEPAPLLAIFWGTPQGRFRPYKQYQGIIPSGSNYCSYDRSINITERGSLVVEYSLWCSAGSYGTSRDTFNFRYQNDDFFLIGYETEEFSRNTGNRIVDSYNFLTWRKQTVTVNEFDSDVPKKETWKKIAKKPLKRLGSFDFDSSIVD